eukprot:TRINITY_DN13147_c0_g1_i1.p1 TRINITY_DN13147_c0_g1~~TRINITY_DN13147_c0_g1_i1.p1  ORF type:complete len:812 (-),score=184.33 TRINITY_DN13147_c0_g1_i1:398-2833(-)
MARPVMPDLYKQLEVEKGADGASIKKSYRKLVLKYHPDKNPDDREAAEEKIRQINSAYETLSNPAKRAAYDAQCRSMETKARGMRVDTTMIRPRMSIPKAFMLCPMGHPDKFLRAVGRGLAFHSRSDVPQVDFNDFFSAAKFSLWWLPEVNNMCRLRTQPTIGTGVVGLSTGPARGQFQGQAPSGHILSFGLSPGVPSSDVMLSDAEQAPCTNVIAIASPDYPGAFRFQSAFFHGHFLAFEPPIGVSMTSQIDQFTAIDYMLMDFGVCEKFRTLDEVLKPAMLDLGGDRKYINLKVVCQDTRVQNYFRTTMAGSFWDYNDFALYFHAHNDVWDYDANSQNLRVRGAQEKYGMSLKRAKTPEEASSFLLAAGKHDIRWLPVDVIQKLLQVLSKPSSALSMKSSATTSDRDKAQATLLNILKEMCEHGGNVSVSGLLPLWPELSSFGGADIAADTKRLRTEVMQVVARCISRQLQSGSGTELDFAMVTRLLDLPMDWQKAGAALAQKAQKVVAKSTLEDIIPLMRKAAGANAGKFGECLATSAMMKTFGAKPAVAVEALDAMVSGGYALDGAAMTLRMLLPQASTESCARVLAGLLERDAAFADVEASWQSLCGKGGLEGLPADLVVRIGSAVARSETHRRKLAELSSAAKTALTSGSWGLQAGLDLLSATCGGAGSSAASSAPGVSEMLAVLEDFLKPKLSDMSLPQIVDVMCALVPLDSSRTLLKVANGRLMELFPSAALEELMRLMRALGRSSAGVNGLAMIVADSWQERLSAEAERVAKERERIREKLTPGDTVRVSGLTSDAGTLRRS